MGRFAEAEAPPKATSLGRLADSDVQRPAWRECHVAYALRTLPPADAELLRRALSRPQSEVQHTEIADALSRDYGVEIDRQSVGRHRAGRCRSCREE
jgi:hypothetical protein